MKLRDIIELAFQRFKTRSLRFFLTVLGVGVGIGVVMFLVSLGFGLQEIVIGRIATSESLLSLTVAVAEEAESLLTIDDEILRDFGEIEHVVGTAPLLSAPVEAVHGGLRAQSIIQAVPESYFRFGGVSAIQGELFSADDPRGLVVSQSFLRLFGLEGEESLGEQIDLTLLLPRSEEEDFLLIEAENTIVPLEVRTLLGESDVNVVDIGESLPIVGIIDTDANVLFMPLEILDQIPNRTYEQVKVRVDSQENLDQVRNVVANEGFTVISLTDTLDQLNRIFQITQITLAVLGTVALFIAGVGMFNTLTISLLERTREVGILKAIGATNADVWKIFLFEAFLIGALGGLAGLFGGLVLSVVVNLLVNILAKRFGGQPVDIFATPLWFVVLIIGLSLGVGIITGLYPARRAARLNPKDALSKD